MMEETSQKLRSWHSESLPLSDSTRCLSPGHLHLYAGPPSVIASIDAYTTCFKPGNPLSRNVAIQTARRKPIRERKWQEDKNKGWNIGEKKRKVLQLWLRCIETQLGYIYFCAFMLVPMTRYGYCSMFRSQSWPWSCSCLRHIVVFQLCLEFYEALQYMRLNFAWNVSFLNQNINNYLF